MDDTYVEEVEVTKPQTLIIKEQSALNQLSFEEEMTYRIQKPYVAHAQRLFLGLSGLSLIGLLKKDSFTRRHKPALAAGLGCLATLSLVNTHEIGVESAPVEFSFFDDHFTLYRPFGIEVESGVYQRVDKMAYSAIDALRFDEKDNTLWIYGQNLATWYDIRGVWVQTPKPSFERVLDESMISIKMDENSLELFTSELKQYADFILTRSSNE